MEKRDIEIIWTGRMVREVSWVIEDLKTVEEELI